MSLPQINLMQFQHRIKRRKPVPDAGRFRCHRHNFLLIERLEYADQP